MKQSHVGPVGIQFLFQVCSLEFEVPNPLPPDSGNQRIIAQDRAPVLGFHRQTCVIFVSKVETGKTPWKTPCASVSWLGVFFQWISTDLFQLFSGTQLFARCVVVCYHVNPQLLFCCCALLHLFVICGRQKPWEQDWGHHAPFDVNMADFFEGSSAKGAVF